MFCLVLFGLVTDVVGIYGFGFCLGFVFVFCVLFVVGLVCGFVVWLVA